MKTLRKYAAGFVLGAILVTAGTGIAANVVKRWQGTVVADKMQMTTLNVGGTDITSTAAELNYVDVTAGTVTASKAVVVDSNKDASAFRTVGVVNLDAGSSGTAGTVDVFPGTASKGKLAITAADSAGDTTTTIVNASQSGARTYTIPDAGASASFVMTEGAQTVNGVKTFGGIPVLPTGGLTAGSTTLTETELGYLDGLTAGTVTASKGLVVDASKNLASLGIITAGNYRRTNGSTFTAADPNPSRATLRAAEFFCVDTTSNAVDLDFSDDADLEAADLGTIWTFAVCVGGSNALTVTDGASGVVVKPQAATTGTTAEDVGDYIRCQAYALEGVICTTYAAD